MYRLGPAHVLSPVAAPLKSGMPPPAHHARELQPIRQSIKLGIIPENEVTETHENYTGD